MPRRILPGRRDRGPCRPEILSRTPDHRVVPKIILSFDRFLPCLSFSRSLPLHRAELSCSRLIDQTPGTFRRRRARFCGFLRLNEAITAPLIRVEAPASPARPIFPYENRPIFLLPLRPRNCNFDCRRRFQASLGPRSGFADRSRIGRGAREPFPRRIRQT